MKNPLSMLSPCLTKHNISTEFHMTVILEDYNRIYSSWVK
jgi:hypothetical protein